MTEEEVTPLDYSDTCIHCGQDISVNAETGQGVHTSGDYAGSNRCGWGNELAGFMAHPVGVPCSGSCLGTYTGGVDG